MFGGSCGVQYHKKLEFIDLYIKKKNLRLKIALKKEF